MGSIRVYLFKYVCPCSRIKVRLYRTICILVDILLNSSDGKITIDHTIYGLRMLRFKNSETAIILFLVTVAIGVDSKATDYGSKRKIVPPTPKFEGTFNERHEHQTIGIRS